MLVKDSDLLKKKKLNSNRVRLSLGDAKGVVLADRTQPLSHYIKDVESTIYFKDLGLQVSWKTVFLVEYAGPILITLGIMAFRKQIFGSDPAYNLNQKLGIAMVLGHYAKRELETIFVHRFSNETMPFMNIFKNSFHYWVLFGVCNMYFLLKPDYKPPSWASDKVLACMTGLFFIFELLNLKCHLILKNLRKEGTTERGIPEGWGFNLVSSANYFWESLCWITFAVQSQIWGGYLFAAVSFGQMLVWALKKHARYLKEFPNYPKNRKSMIPFVI